MMCQCFLELCLKSNKVSFFYISRFESFFFVKLRQNSQQKVNRFQIFNKFREITVKFTKRFRRFQILLKFPSNQISIIQNSNNKNGTIEEAKETRRNIGNHFSEITEKRRLCPFGPCLQKIFKHHKMPSIYSKSQD